MCGICGFTGENKALLKQMTSLLSHRGPDGEGTYSDGKISFGHRRLSIIDLSSAGRQPMSNEDGTIWITFNGEIYNFQELRNDLERRGHSFASNTDTETIIHGYEEWGENVVQRLNGMFAFAIWNAKTETLFLARDRLGVKPLYYYLNYLNKNQSNSNLNSNFKKNSVTGEKLAFSSEIKALLADATIPRELNRKALRQYLNFRYIPGSSIRRDETLFEEIKILPPGHTLTLKNAIRSPFGSKNGGSKALVIKEYWDLPVQQDEKIGTAAEIRERLRESVRKRLIADVPVGIYLSGGIDSAGITALAAQIKKEKDDKTEKDEAVKTFSVGFDHSSEVDELSQAKIIAQHCQTDHTEIIVKGGVSELLPKLIWHLDQPHGDPVIIPQYYLSQKAKEKVTVVLSGEGADEIFGGYVQYQTMLKAQKLCKMPLPVLQTAARCLPIKILDQFFDYPASIGEKGKEKLLDFLGNLNDEEKAYRDLISILSRKDREKLFARKREEEAECPKIIGIREIAEIKDTRETKRDHEHRQPLLHRLMYNDTKTWLPNYVLFINDRMTMANGIEGRTPFLDYTFVEHVHHLHPSLKINSRQNKVILREALKPLLPSKIVDGKKHAFFTPLDQWYKEELKDLAQQLFTPSSVQERGIYNYDYLQNIWEKYPHSPLLYGKQLFTVINLELWQQQFLCQEKLKPMPLKQLLH